MAPGVEDGQQQSALVQQLAKCSASSDNLMADMRKAFVSRFDRSDVLLQLSTRYLLVGRCDSRFAGVAHFLPSKVIYVFEHPQHRHVEMHMAYADMDGVRMQAATLRRGGAAYGATCRAGGGGNVGSSGGSGGSELRFRINGPLAYFARDYDPSDATHDLRIGFESESDLERFRTVVWPHLSSLFKTGSAPSAEMPLVRTAGGGSQREYVTHPLT